MGQYFLTVNKTKKQYLCPHAFQDGAKAWEIVANGGMLKGLGYLLTTSDGGGGGDLKQNPFVGYWAGDEIILVGDYDSSKLYGEAADTYTDISSSVITAMLKEDGGECIFHPEIIKDMKERMKKKGYKPIPFEELSTTKRELKPEPVPEKPIVDIELLEMLGEVE